ncbi:hypothetical protein FQR65_LT13362 [Abscondita terminalis]|nr:hypothetical protein FQR65_LT13362 [Abscondita terminalis]
MEFAARSRTKHSTNDYMDLPPLETEPNINWHPKKIESGNRIVNVGYFIDQCRQITQHDYKCTMGKMIFQNEIKTGMFSCFNFSCHTCDKNLKIYSHPPQEKGEVNKMVAWGTNSVGMVYAQTEKFLSILNVPVMSSRYFRKTENLLSTEWEVLQKQIKKAGEEEKQKAVDAGDFEEGIPFISGVSVINGKRTGKLLFLEVRNKYCSTCSTKQLSEVQPHICYKNYTGPPTGMEQDIIVQGFNESVQNHGVRYKYVVGDGDSSVYARIVEFVSYGRSVVKLECANHVTRCYTSQLHKI